MMTNEQYIRLLKTLFPLGKAWSRASDGVLHKICDAMAAEMVRLDNRASIDLLREIDPSTTFELLPDWERIVGLPDFCTGLLADTLEFRRDDVLRKLSDRGGQSRQFFIDLALVFGYVVTIQDVLPFRSGRGRSGDRCYGVAWKHHWIVNSVSFATTVFRSGQSRSGDRLRTWRNDTLECVFNQKKPSHTKVHFTYGS